MQNFLLIFTVFYHYIIVSTEYMDPTEICNSKPCEPGPEGEKPCQNFGYCNPRSKQCCLGHYGNCTFPGSRPIRPQKNCANDDECGAATYCDRTLKICCTEGGSPESYCPGKITFLSVEPSCRNNVTCPVNSTCVEGSCCPSHKTVGSIITPLYYPYTTHRKCRDYEAPPLWNMFCRRDAQRWAILGEYRVNGTENVATEIFCRTNDDCSPSTVCIQVSAAVGLCYDDPMTSPVPSDYPDPYWLTFYVSLPTACLLFGCLILIYKKKKHDYYQ